MCEQLKQVVAYYHENLLEKVVVIRKMGPTLFRGSGWIKSFGLFQEALAKKASIVLRRAS